MAVGLYAPPSDGPRKTCEARIPAWTDLENVPVEPSQQTALTFRHRMLTGVVEPRQQPTLHISTPGSHRHSPSALYVVGVETRSSPTSSENADCGRTAIRGDWPFTPIAAPARRPHATHGQPAAATRGSPRSREALRLRRSAARPASEPRRTARSRPASARFRRARRP